MHGVVVDDRVDVRPMTHDVIVKPPFGRWQAASVVVAGVIEQDDIIGLDAVVGHTRRRDQQAVVDACTDIAGGALVDAEFAHLEASGDDLPSQGVRLIRCHG